MDAGAVFVGRTNTPEFSFRADTENPLYGRTNNPWGKHLSPGGSSGGASSAVMAGMCTLAHGNDIGGSLRFPSVATGAVTLKPGLGRCRRGTQVKLVSEEFLHNRCQYKV